MENSFYIVLCILFLTLVSCNDDTKEINNSFMGAWIIESTSGGIAGIGYNPNFSDLVIEQDSAFMLMRNDTIIASGELTKIGVTGDFPYWFNADFRLTTDYIDIIDDNGKDIMVEDNVMDITSPCCDRFDTRLVRE